MRKKIIFETILFLLAIFYGACPGFTETIKLKSGQTVEGKIIEKTSSHVKMDVNGIILTYFSDDLEPTGIAVAEETGSTEKTSIEKTSPASPESNEYYVNEKLKIIAWHPKDWKVYDRTKNSTVFKTLLPPDIKTSPFYYVCAFSPAPGGKRLDPLVILISQAITSSPSELTPEKLAEILNEGIKRPNALIKIVERPQVVELNGKKIVRQIYIRTEKGNKDTIIKYSLVKKQRLFTIACSVNSQNFDEYKRDFENIVTNFKTTD